MTALPLGSQLHVHLTTSQDGVKVKGYKPTVIHLIDDNGLIRQTDLMITRHFVTKEGYNVAEICEEVLKDVERIQASGIDVSRTKLEYEGLLDNCLYLECHALAYIPDHLSVSEFKKFAQLLNLRVSNNPKTVVEGGRHYFVNDRMHFGNLKALGKETFRLSVIERLKELAELCDGLVEIEDPRFESAIYDSNLMHDRWWA